MVSAEKTSTGPIGLGTRFRAEMRSMGRPIEMTIEFTGYKRSAEQSAGCGERCCPTRSR
jgi:hypothetical protein